MNYQGYKCPVCDQLFTESDDVVVCPVCGAPHHRECYKQHGGCAMQQLHAQGKSWNDQMRQQAPGPESEPGQHHSQSSYAGGSGQSTGVQRCPGCGASNPSDSIFCQVCGVMLGRRPGSAGAPGGYPGGAPGGYPGGYPGAPGGYPGSAPGQTYYDQQSPNQPPNYYANASSPYAGLNPEEKLGGVTVKELATYIGPASPHYLPRFKAINDHGGRAFVFSWSAFLFNFVYFFYRKMYKVAIPLLIFFAFTMVPTFVYSFAYIKEIVAQYGTITFPIPVINTPALDQLAVIISFLRMLQFGVAAVMGFVANRLYLADCAAKIGKLRGSIQNESGTVDTGLYIQQLTLRGGVSTSAVGILLGSLVVVYFVVSYLMTYAILP